MPINLISNIEPQGGNTWFIVEDKFVKGGFHSVADVNARDNINLLNLKPGMLVYTIAEQQLWQLGNDSITWSIFRAAQDSVFRVGVYVYEDPIVGDVDYIFTDDVYFSTDFHGCKAIATVMPTNDVVVDIQKNHVELVGQILFTPTTITFTGLPVLFAEGDVLSLRFPEDNGMEKISITLKGSFDPL